MVITAVMQIGFDASIMRQEELMRWSYAISTSRLMPTIGLLWFQHFTSAFFPKRQRERYFCIFRKLCTAIPKVVYHYTRRYD